MERVNGLPAHPLFVHAPVVLVPLAVLGTLAVLARPAWRQRFGPALAVLSVVALVTTLLAVRSGEAFERLVGDQVDVSQHKQLGLTTRWMVALFTLGTLVYVGLDRSRRRADQPGGGSVPALVVAGLTAAVGLAATVWIIRTGDSGARLVWDGFLRG